METVFIYSVNSDELVCLNDGVITGNNDAYDDVVVDVIVEFDYGTMPVDTMMEVA
tara:strand:- start:30 stop:194 length:165 start_codon:yes stop_codon:yes gene_type:complete